MNTATIRETSRIPRGWRPGLPLPPSVRRKVVQVEMRADGLGAHPTVVARVKRKQARERGV